jgi:hypothetical protein
MNLIFLLKKPVFFRIFIFYKIKSKLHKCHSKYPPRPTVIRSARLVFIKCSLRVGNFQPAKVRGGAKKGGNQHRPAPCTPLTEGMVHWLLRDAYAIAFGNKHEYSSRVRGVGKNIRPVPGTTQTYYTPKQGRSQCHI